MRDKYDIHNPINRSDENPFSIQHDPTDYYHPNYINPLRMSSYSYQYRLALTSGGNSFLNIGSANDVLRSLLIKQKKTVINLDLDLHTHPDVTAIFPYLPFKSSSFDVVLCFQTLEHLPFSMINSCFRELRRISKNNIIISVPDMSLSKREMIKYLIYKILNHPREWKKYKSRKIDKEHFWEIGDGVINFKSLLSAIEGERLEITNHFRNRINSYHHFFVLKTSK